jgi:hypothetical protein
LLNGVTVDNKIRGFDKPSEKLIQVSAASEWRQPEAPQQSLQPSFTARQPARRVISMYPVPYERPPDVTPLLQQESSKANPQVMGPLRLRRRPIDEFDQLSPDC